MAQSERKPEGHAQGVPEEMSKIILDLCGGTGAWSKPYKDAGYDVRVVTLPNEDILTYLPPPEVHGILAAPPCTMFSLARQNAKIPRNFRQGMKTVEACLRIIWASRHEGKLSFWALENPTGYLRQFLGVPKFKFKPSEFGDPIGKRTDLWGYFNPPKKLKVPVDVPIGTHRASLNYHRDPILRAITPPGFAQAFFKANQ